MLWSLHGKKIAQHYKIQTADCSDWPELKCSLRIKKQTTTTTTTTLLAPLTA